MRRGQESPFPWQVRPEKTTTQPGTDAPPGMRQGPTTSTQPRPDPPAPANFAQRTRDRAPRTVWRQSRRGCSPLSRRGGRLPPGRAPPARASPPWLRAERSRRPSTTAQSRQGPGEGAHWKPSSGGSSSPGAAGRAPPERSIPLHPRSRADAAGARAAGRRKQKSRQKPGPGARRTACARPLGPTKRGWQSLSRRLVDRSARPHPGIEFNLAERALVSGDILLQQSEQRFGLLGTQINSLKITDVHLALGLLLQSAEHQEEIPDIYPHLHTVGIVLAIVRVIGEFHIGLCRIVHGGKCKSFSDSEPGATRFSTNRALNFDKICHAHSETVAAVT